MCTQTYTGELGAGRGVARQDEEYLLLPGKATGLSGSLSKNNVKLVKRDAGGGGQLTAEIRRGISG